MNGRSKNKIKNRLQTNPVTTVRGVEIPANRRIITMKRISVVLLGAGFSVGTFVLAQTAMTFDVDAKSIVNYRSASEIQVIFGGEGQSDSRGGDGQSGRSGAGDANGGGGVAGNSGSGSSSGSSASGESSGSESGAGVGGAGNAGNAGNAGGVGNSASGGMIAHFFRNLFGW